MQGELGLDDWSWKRITLEIRRQLPLGAKKWLEMYPQPVLINRYVRKYFITRDKKVRVTLDKNLDIYDLLLQHYKFGRLQPTKVFQHLILLY